MFGFSYYLLLPLARGTNGNGYSSSAPLLPTPLASDTGDVGKGLDIQISANGSYRKMNKDGKAWTARLSHVVYRMTPTTLERPYLNPDWVEWLMIDGVLNNAPSLGELEAKAKAGEQISLTALAAAIKTEEKAPKAKKSRTAKPKKPSIRAQLDAAKKEQSKQTPPREKTKELEV